MGNAIGIDLSSHGIKLVQVSRRRGTLRLLGAYSSDVGCRESSDGKAEAGTRLAETVREAKLGTNAAVVVGLPYEKVFFGHLRTDVSKPEDVRRLLKFELEDDLPVPFDDLVADICGRRQVGDGREEYLIAAVRRQEIDTWAHAWNDAGRPCSVCSTDVCALEAVARRIRPDGDGPAVLAHADGHRMILGLSHGGTILCARHTACMGEAQTIGRTLAREIELTWRRALGRQHQQPVEILLSGPDRLVQELSGELSRTTGHSVRLLRPSSVFPPPAASDLDGQFTIALGLALIGLGSAREELNFLSADLSQADRAAKSRAKQAARMSAVLLVALLGLLGLRTFREWRTLEASRAATAREIRAVFLDVFPDEKKIVSEPAQMTEHLDSLRKERGMLAALIGKRVQPLKVLYLLSEKMTSEKGIGISSFSIKDKAIHITGTGNSFESIEQFLEELRQVPEFDSIELEDMAQSRGGTRPEFRLLISVRIG